MSPRMLEAIERVLMAALAVILALGVWNAFLRVIDEDTAPAASGTTDAPDVAGGTSAATTTTIPIVVRSTTTTIGVSTTEDPDGFPFKDGVCRQTQPRTTESVTLLRIYYNCGNIIEPTGANFVYRTVPRTAQRLGATMSELVKGPTDAERALGFGSFFSSDTADAFRGVTISDGRAFVDFNPFDVPEAVMATDQGRQFFVINIAANALQYDSVTSVEIRLGGSCEAFSELIGASGCTVITQSDL
ncbi:MAG: GerMN domain-containing protein [Acidimicrobiia bacterium]|nr:GerMN domain-containing protein [Acidimicrobiia bacterium]